MEMLQAVKEMQARCPLCGNINNCAMAAGKSISACWCQGETVPEDMAENVAFGNVCYCRKCLIENEGEGV